MGCLLLIGVASLFINRFYNQNYGRVMLSTRQQARAAIATFVFVPVVFGGSLLVRSRANWSLDLPVNPIAASFALAMLTFYLASVGLRAHHSIILGCLLVIGLLPVWGGADPSNIGLVLTGVAVLVAGILDHRLLVRAFGPAKALKLQNSDAGA